jgi:pimeloyl-ACP methyl ester carboxylesterase
MTARDGLSRSEKSTIVRSEKKPQPGRKPPWAVALSVLDRAWPEAAARVSFDLFLRPRRFPRPARELAALQAARSILVPTDRAARGARSHAGPAPLRAWVWGDDGPVVLLVHGWQGRGAQLAPFVEPLVARGFRVAAFDAPAHGDTPGTHASLFAFRDAILAMHAALGPFHALVSHSMGGAAAILAAKELGAGQEEHAVADRYALICPPNDVRDFTAELTKALGLSEATREAVHRRLERTFGVKLADVRAPEMVRERREPLLLVHDRNDVEVPFDRGEAIAAAWPGAELVATEGLGHRRILSDPHVVARVVDHVASSARRA